MKIFKDLKDAKQALTIYFLENDKFHIPFQLTNLSVADHFINRKAKMKEIEEHLLTTKTQNRQKIHIFYDLEKIEKT